MLAPGRRFGESPHFPFDAGRRQRGTCVLEIIFLCVTGAGLARLARLRGGHGWPWVVLMIGGYLVVTSITAFLFGRGPNVIVGLLWIALMFPLVILVVGKGRRVKSSWQCPNCQFFNEPTTLVCPCGYRVPSNADA